MHPKDFPPETVLLETGNNITNFNRLISNYFLPLPVRSHCLTAFNKKNNCQGTEFSRLWRVPQRPKVSLYGWTITIERCRLWSFSDDQNQISSSKTTPKRKKRKGACVDPLKYFQFCELKVYESNNHIHSPISSEMPYHELKCILEESEQVRRFENLVRCTSCHSFFRETVGRYVTLLGQSVVINPILRWSIGEDIGGGFSLLRCGCKERLSCSCFLCFKMGWSFFFNFVSFRKESILVLLK